MSATIFTALPIPAVITHPSQHCLQWTEDGQICLVTKSAVHILTPDAGINISAPPDVKASAPGDQTGKPIGWFKTAVETDRATTYYWPSYSQDWSTVTLGSLDLSITALACSPTNMSSRGRCMLAVLNSNCEVSIWEAGRHHLKGEWVKVLDVTSFLLDGLANNGEDHITMALRAQATSLAWSSQPDFGIVPVPVMDGSALAIGNRAGDLMLFRLEGRSSQQRSVSHLGTVKFSKHRITQIAWSSWRNLEIGHSIAFVACSLDSGSLVTLKVEQKALFDANTSMSGQQYKCVLSTATPVEVHPPDKRGTTGLVWIDRTNQPPICLFTKPGTVHLWCSPASRAPWSGCRVLELRNIPLSAGSSPLTPLSGATYVKSRDKVVLAFLDGSFHVIHNASSDPSWASPISEGGAALDSQLMSTRVRGVLGRESAGSATWMDVGRTYGMASYDGAGAFAWVYEKLRPSDFSYKFEAKHENTLIVASMYAETDENVVKRVVEELNDLKPQGGTPLNRLPDDTTSLGLAAFTLEAGRDYSDDLRLLLKTHLYGRPSLTLLRLRLGIADMCWKVSQSDEARNACGEVAQPIIREISSRVLRIIMTILQTIVPLLTKDDLPFLRRIMVQAHLPGLSVDLPAVENRLTSDLLSSRMTSSEELLEPLHDECPACKSDVIFADLQTATCPKGHSWSRCSITSFILATPNVRTCVGCARKALLPSAETNGVASDVKGWFVLQLLSAVQHCLFCGNSFIQIV
ncbi:hypothetical protein CONPUDRAFT_169750 [Coniophora puteana RWD-64-598 SS2]|uniref:Transcription factor IIIC putative zinc-finger domain-containing protein n=1 Tax=Coniophora puteana (strain RWD-64-598) TaxID=741705 RepID=A0A5M3M797_CONPW|nr:uncharacterized protein CONPUDRAFT_169750 [Coniophora puteana RWD-64-598 SS2]EIW74796.1 hypothetical protein CONPUDRAFT_169750 [Coniophora puteana RWD-64-598 SS2]